jgi:peptide/nickel transport system permease protein
VNTVAATRRGKSRTRWLPALKSRAASLRPIQLVCVAIIGLAALVAIFGPMLAPYDPNASSLADALVGPSAAHPLGFDGQGRDLLSRLLVGARTSLLGPLFVVVVTMLTAVTVSILSAWRGGWVDAGASAVLDVLFAFPAILLAVLAIAVFGPGLVSASLALSLAYTPYIARVLRAAAVRERNQPYIAALEVQGLPSLAICARHLVPNVFPMIVAQGTILFGYAMVDLAAISFLGLGVQPPQSDWGVMVAEGQSGLLQGYPAESLAAGLCIVLVVVAFNLLGESLAKDEGGRPG